MSVSRHLLALLACPRDRTPLAERGERLVCPQGHEYPVVDGVPVLLLDDARQTIGVAEQSLARATRQSGAADERAPELYLESLGISEAEKEGVIELARRGDQAVDPVVSYIIGATSGYAYKQLIGRLREYPIPQLHLPPGAGRRLLDVGCNWGRWSIAAARSGYRVVGIDPQLGAVMAARRVARQLGQEIDYCVADARFLPFADAAFDATFSYSVIQHLSYEDAGASIAEMGRVLRSAATCLVQMPTVFGIRCLYHQFRRGWRPATGFEVRYWTIPRLRRLFQQSVGPAKIQVDCYFGIGLQPVDRPMLPPLLKLIVTLSECLRLTSHYLPPLRYLADSVYVSARKQ